MPKTSRTTKQRRRSKTMDGMSGRRVKKFSQAQTDKILRLPQAGKVHKAKSKTRRRTQQIKEPLLLKLLTSNKVIIGLSLVAVSIVSMYFFAFFTKPEGQVLGAIEEIAISVPEVYGDALVVNKDGNSLMVTPQSGDQVQVTQEANRYIYYDAYPFTDVIQTDLTYKIKEEIAFKQPGHPTSFTYTLGNADSYSIEEDRDGNILFYDREAIEAGVSKQLGLIFTIPTPFVEDANKNRSFSAVTTTIENGEMTVSVDPAWLRSARYPVVLDPTVEISILNVQSHPRQGEDWVVSFTTGGTADLYIIPNDQATIDDDVFESLSCDGVEYEPEMLSGDIIYFENWSCSGVGEVVHYTAVEGKHTLRFEFVDPEDPDNKQVAYAYNDPADPWWDTNWLYRKEIIIQSSEVTFDGTFPVLVTTTDALLADTGNGGKVEFSAGTDIAFANDSGTLLDFEREYYDNTTGELVAWVEASISSSADTSIYVYYGNSGASDQEDVEGTWDANYMMVQHFEETSSTQFDSTSNNNDTTTETLTTQGGASLGQIGPANDYDGVNDRLVIGDSASLDISNTGTIEAWISTDDVSTIGGPLTDWRDDVDDPDGGSAGEYSSFDMTIVNESMYYAAAMCGPAAFEYASSNLNGNSLTWSTLGTPPGACGSSEGYDVAIDSDGDFLWYAALGVSNTTVTFSYATSTLDQSTFSAWQEPGAPSGTGHNEGSGLDMVIVGNKMYFAATPLNGGTEDFEFASVNLDGSGWSGWDETTASPPTGGSGGGSCGLGLDSDGVDLYYASMCHGGATMTYETATSSLAQTSFSSWRNEPDPTGSESGEMHFNDIVIAGDKAYHAAYIFDDIVNHNYQVASSSIDGSSFSTWVSEQDGSGLPSEAGDEESSAAAVVTDGKNLYYGAMGVNGTTEGFVLASSTLSSFPFLSKVRAYEAIQTGGGFMFDWAGAPKTFGTTTQASTFTHVAITHDGSTMNYYVDGDLKRTQDVTANFITNANNLFVGYGQRNDQSDLFFNGVIDEVRISDTARSATWLETQFNNQNSVGDFITIGSEENAPSSNATPTISSVTDSPDPVPANQSIYWNVDWNDTDAGDLVKVIVCKDNVITTSTLACVGGTWCESPVFTNRDPEGLCSYPTQVSDIGAQTYYAYVCDNTGDSTTACSAPTTGTFTVEDQDPTAPTNLLLERYTSPAINIATNTPRFSAVFNDPNTDDIADKYCIEVNTQSDFQGTDIWTSDGDSCGTGTSMGNCTQGEQCSDLYFKGTPLAIDQSVYYWHIVYWDDASNKGATSTTANFTMSNGANGEGKGVRFQGGLINGGVRLQ